MLGMCADLHHRRKLVVLDDAFKASSPTSIQPVQLGGDRVKYYFPVGTKKKGRDVGINRRCSIENCSCYDSAPRVEELCSKFKGTNFWWPAAWLKIRCPASGP